MAAIEFQNVSKSFGKTAVVSDLNLKIQDGSFTVLVGPSGCGKTTLLRMIAGLEPATSGKVLIDNVDVTDTEIGKRGVAMVFQNYAIYPTMSVRANIEFGLINNKVPKETRDKRVKEISDIVGLTQYLDRMPETLSGGQRQRIALARAMVKNPKVFLMDEPLSNLDAKLRVSMRVELIELHKKLKTTFVYVTHDQVEAMSMADMIVLLNNGEIQQQGSPENMYRDPQNVFTAQFIGSPPMNVFRTDGIRGFVGFRPEKAIISYEKKEGTFAVPGIIKTREMLGSEILYKVELSFVDVMVKSLDDGFHINDKIYLIVEEKNLYFFHDDGTRIRQQESELSSMLKAVEAV